MAKCNIEPLNRAQRPEAEVKRTHLTISYLRTLRATLLRSLVLGLLVMAQFSHAASQELFGGALGDWLRRDAQVKLTELLSSHPRFHGERIRVVVMHEGTPATESDGLTQAIRAQLTHKLAQIDNVQLVWGETARGCRVPRKTPYLLGVEVTRESRSRHLVRVAMVDVDEGVWVSGANLQWRGQLNQAEQRASQTASVDGQAGTIDKPLSASNRAAVVEQLLESIQCSLQGGVEGSVYIAAADESDTLLVELSRKLREQVMHSAWLTVAENAETADWQLRLAAKQDVGESVVATLDSGASDTSTQRLAAVYVRRKAPDTKVARSGPTPSGATRDAQAPLTDNLLSEITPVTPRPGERCFSPRDNCMEVGFDMAAPGYVMVMRTVDGAVSLSSCKQPVRTSGVKRYRFKTSELGRQAPSKSTSIYAVATQDRSLAVELHREFFRAASNCGGAIGVHDDDWLAALDAMVSRAPEEIYWQAFYRSPKILAKATSPNEQEMRK